MNAARHLRWQAQVSANACGQACVAMLTGADAHWLATDLGSVHATTTRQLAEIVRRYGYDAPDRLRRLTAAGLPDLAIVKLAYRKPCGRLESTWHWVLWAQERFWDPGVAEGVTELPPTYGEITSYLPVQSRAGVRDLSMCTANRTRSAA